MVVDGHIVAVNPGDRADVLGQFAFSITSVDDAVGAARQGLPNWSALSPEDRASALRRLAELIGESQGDLARLITRSAASRCGGAARAGSRRRGGSTSHPGRHRSTPAEGPARFGGVE